MSERISQLNLNQIQRKREEYLVNRPLMASQDTPGSVLRKLRHEVGELAEELNGEDRQKIGEEIADVVLYCASLASLYGINLREAALAKVIKDERRFPAALFQDETQKFEEVYLAQKEKLGELQPRHAVLFDALKAGD